MNPNAVIVGYALLATLLLWLVIGVRGKWAVKLAAIVLVLGFAFPMWGALGAGAGWPTSTAPPKGATFISCVVIEPDPATKTTGAIYLWLGSASGVPRSYSQPYSRSLHIACLQAKNATAHGAQVGIGIARRRRGHGRHAVGPRSVWHAYILPPVHPHTKEYRQP